MSLGAFVLELPGPLGELTTPAWLRPLAALEADAPVSRSEEVRQAMRELLRHGGYKPTGRGKPSAEYLAQAARKGPLPEINLVVDLINVVSLHAGLSISVVDLDLLREPLDVRAAEPDASYVFNASGQTIQLGGLLCLHDAEGPCANAVKDAQRTKTHPATRSVLMLVWGSLEVGAQSAATLTWLRELAGRVGAVRAVELQALEETP
ncbi:MAG: hypothetical protein KDD82_03445 [Planctomycetes bacterium]|nr:hypothetical protein [Planctomycetota bacterium]